MVWLFKNTCQAALFPEAKHWAEVFGLFGELYFWGIERADGSIEVERIWAVEVVSEEQRHLVEGDLIRRDDEAEMPI